MRQKILILLCFIISQNLLAKSLGLTELQKLAYKNNNRLKAAQINTEMAGKKRDGSKGAFYPKFGIQAGVEQTTNSEASATDSEASQFIYGEYNLFNGFRDQNTLSKNTLNSKLRKSEYKETEFVLHLKIEKLYYSYLYLDKIIKNLTDTLLRNQQHILLIKKRLSAGLVTKTDLLEFELKKSKLQSKLDFTNLKRQEVAGNLSRIVGVENFDDLVITENLPHYQVNTTFEQLMVLYNKNSESLRRSQLNLAVSNIDTEIGNSHLYPSIDLSAQYGNQPQNETGIDSDYTSTSIMVMAKWELFSGFESSYNKEEAKLNTLKNNYLLKQKLLDDSSILKTYLHRMKAVEARIQNEEDNREISFELYSRTLKEYKKGIKDSGALSSAGNQLTHINDQVYALKMDLIKTKISLESVLGAHVPLKQISHK